MPPPLGLLLVGYAQNYRPLQLVVRHPIAPNSAPGIGLPDKLVPMKFQDMSHPRSILKLMVEGQVS